MTTERRRASFSIREALGEIGSDPLVVPERVVGALVWLALLPIFAVVRSLDWLLAPDRGDG